MKRTSKKNIQTSKIQNKKEKPVNKPENNSFLKKNLKYFFLAFILFCIATDLYNAIYEKHIFENYQKLLLIPAILTGIIALYYDKNKLSEIVNSLFITETKKQTFSEKIKSFFSKKELISTSVFIIILGISAFTLFYKLGNFDFFSDEVQVSKGAAGYYYTGEFYQWDFIKDKKSKSKLNRAKPHLYLISQSYKLFGINEWSSRFPSALSGFIFIFLMYFIGRFFVKDKSAVLLAVLSFSVYYEFLFLGRWARMYALMFPIVILAFYWTFKFLNEKNSYYLFNSGKSPFLEKYFNFNYIFLPFLLIILYIGFNIHTNIAVLFPIFYLFIFFGILIFKNEKKYLSAFIIVSIILLLQIAFPYKINFSRFTFFKIDNSEIYNKAIFGYPFNIRTNIVIILTGLSSLFFIKNIQFRKIYLILFITAFFIWSVFSFVINYAPSYRYVSFFTPFIVLLIAGFYVLICKTLYGKAIQYFLTLLFIFSLSVHFKNHYKDLYVENSYSPAKVSIAEKVIVNNFHKGDILLKHWGPDYYLQGIDTATQTFGLGSYTGKPLIDIFEIMKNHTSGWLFWHKYFENHLDPQVVSYANLYLKKFAGYGIDNYGEEIYYYNKKMLQPLQLFVFQQYLPVANLNLKNSYSFVFDLKINNKTDNSVFYFRNDSTVDIDCFVKNNNLIIKNSKNDSIFISLPQNLQNQIIWSFNPEKSILYLNGNKLAEKSLKLNPDLVKFQINTQFNGYIDNIRIYDFNPDAAQIKAIANDKNISEELSANNKPFRTLFLWKQKK